MYMLIFNRYKLDQFLQFLHEHTHWLLMIVGFVLADAGDGEYPTVPIAFLRLSNSQVDYMIIGDLLNILILV